MTVNEASLDWSDIQRIWLTPTKDCQVIIDLDCQDSKDNDLDPSRTLLPVSSTPHHLEKVRCDLRDILADLTAEDLPPESDANFAPSNLTQLSYDNPGYCDDLTVY